jgi:hypothetical protein
LANRFNIVVFEPVPGQSLLGAATAAETSTAATAETKKALHSELMSIAAVVLASEDAAEISLAASLCVTLWHAALKPSAVAAGISLTLRQLVRLLDAAYRLRQFTKSSRPLPTCLYWAFRTLVKSQLADTIPEAVIEELESDVMASLTPSLSGAASSIVQQKIDVLSEVGNISSSTTHVVVGSRATQLELLLMASSVCGHACLLEGPAAVGKTSLLVELAASKSIKVIRVNNSDTTTVQDYLGTYMPKGALIEFVPGALIEAMKAGCWFLAGKFNVNLHYVESNFMT